MKKYFLHNILLLILILTSLISSLGGIVYYFYSLNNIGIAISLILSLIFFVFIVFFHYRNFKIERKKINYSEISNPKQNDFSPWQLDLILMGFYLLLITACFYILFKNQSAEAIISPWQAVPVYFFFFYFLATIFLFILIINKSRFSLWLISVHYFLSFSIALIVYLIGYGFDPFIHQITLELIEKTGSVEPKPFYYLGQYALILILHKITGASIIGLDKFLVPALSAVYLPFFAYQFAKKWLADNKISFMSLILLLIIPYSVFIVTTPQNLSYLFLIITVFYALIGSSGIEILIAFLFALASFIIHPLAGIPALLIFFPYLINHLNLKKYKKTLLAIWFALSALILPAIFYFINLQSKNYVIDNYYSNQEQHNGIINLLKDKFVSSAPNKENIILNFLYLIGFNYGYLLAFLIIVGWLIACRHRRECRMIFYNFSLALALLLGLLIINNYKFSFLIQYERDDYQNRILVLIVIVLLPVLLLALYNFGEKILRQKKSFKIIFCIFLSLVITSSLYLSYPRHDSYFNSRGYSAGLNDFEAVRFIESNHENNYIVLANQQVSVAALRELGFNNYIEIEPSLKIENLKLKIFRYPIPTGGQLYQYYLKMVYESPSKETMDKAMDYAGVSESYFVLNKYWWAFTKILEEAKLEASSWQEIANGEIYIFKYLK